MTPIQKCKVFDSRFVPHRNIWLKGDEDAAFECIDRTNYSSVVVRLQRFSTTDMERRKKGIQKAVGSAIKHSSLCDLKEVLVDEENRIIISISENARGINFQRFVELCSNKEGYDESLQHILLTLLQLYRDLHASDLDLSSLSLTHVVISLKNNSVSNVESVKVRRPFLCKFDQNRASTLPYSRFEAYPAFTDLAAAAFFSFQKEDLFGYSSILSALASLPSSQKCFFELLLAFQQHEFDAVCDIIKNMYNVEALEQPEPSLQEEVVEKAADLDDDFHSSDESESDVSEDDEKYEVSTANESETETALDEEEDDLKTAIGTEVDEDLMTAIGDDEELNTAIDVEEFEINTAIDEEEDEVKTAIEDEYDETRTAIEEDMEEVKTAIAHNFDIVDKMLVNVDALSLLPITPEVDDMFDARSLISNESDFDVILSADVVDEPQIVFTTKDYGFDGLIIKLFDNECVCCELNDQFVTFGSDMIEIGSSDSRDGHLLATDILQKLVSNVRVMYALTDATVPKKNYLVTFVEEEEN
uniref:Uncharacterized protein n=1 Tax=Panagrolaimus superbus TaxID=310955 RepID=A0A914Z6E7_9BILA